MSLPTTQDELTELTFDLGAEAAVGADGKRLWVAASDGRRGLEILFILAEARHANGFLDTIGLRRRMTNPPGLDQVRRLLRAVEERGLARFDFDADRIALNVQPAGQIRPTAFHLRRGLDRLQLLLRSERGAELGPKEQTQLLILQAEDAMTHGRHSQALESLIRRPDGASMARWIEQNTRGATRARLSLAANTVLAEASMNLADVPSALAYTERGRRWAAGFEESDEWVLRLAGAEAAALRMQAALLPGSQREILDRCIERFRSGDEQVVHAKHIPSEEQLARRRLLLAESSTPLCLSGDLRGASENLAKAESLLGRFVDDGTNATTTTLLRGRIELANGNWRGASHLIDEVKAAIIEQGAPQWVRGWTRRYSADIAWASGAGVEELRSALRLAWIANDGFDFQRLQLLARFAFWNVEPVSPKVDGLNSKDQAILRQASRLTTLWHARIHGLPPSKCRRCRGASLLRRIRCTLGLGAPLGKREHSGLGVWR